MLTARPYLEYNNPLVSVLGVTERILGDNTPEPKQLPAFNLIVEYAVDIVETADQTTSGIQLYLSSDQLRYLSPEGAEKRPCLRWKFQ